MAQGMSCPEVGRLVRDSAGGVRYWVHRFEATGFAGLAAGELLRRPSRLREKQLEEISAILRESPSSVGLSVNLWDGKTLAQFIGRHWGIELGVRQCQRLSRQLGFRSRKPLPLIARADPENQSVHKKAPQASPKRRR